jgi:hypothetical protein
VKGNDYAAIGWARLASRATDFEHRELLMVRSPNFRLSVIALFIAGLGILSSAAAGDERGNLLCAAPQDPKALQAFHDCAGGAGCYSKEQAFVLDGAMRYLDYRLEHPNGGERLAIVVDIDDTALSNWVYIRETNFVYNRSTIMEWWKKEQDPAIPGTLALVKHALERNVAVFLISGRPEVLRNHTEGNLQAAGYPAHSIKATGGIFLKDPPRDPDNPCAYKTLRRRGIAEKGFTIILNVGDQYSDLESCDPAGRRLTGTVSFRGERLVKLPNPFYCIP